MEEQISKMIDVVVLPIVDTCAKLYKSLIPQFSVNCSVGLIQDTIRSLDACV